MPTEDRTGERIAATILATDPGGRVTFWPPSAEWLLGFSAETMLGRPFTDLLADPVEPHAWKLPPDDEATEHAARLRTRAGDTRDVILFRQIGSAAGGLPEVLYRVVDADLLARRQPGTLAPLEILNDATTERYAFSAADGRLLFPSRRALETLQHSARDLADMTLADLSPDLSDRALAEYVARLGTPSTPETVFSTRHRRKDGSLYPVEIRLQTWLDGCCVLASGQPLGSDGRAQRLQHPLHEMEARAQAILDGTPDAVVTIDHLGVIESFNRGAERMFGYDAREVIGQNVSLLMPSPHREKHDHYLYTYHATGRANVIGVGREVTAVRKDGSLFPADLAVTEVDLGHRHIFSGILRDLSERRRLEREILEVSTEEQQRIGQELHDGIGSHLTGVALLCRALTRRVEKGETVQPADLAEVADLLNEAAQKTRLLSHSLTAFRVAERGLEAALRELTADMQKLTGIPCVYQGPGEEIALPDEIVLHLYRIAQEAIINAVKHARAACIWVRLTRTASSLVLMVRDDGIGLSAAESGDGIGRRVMHYRAHLIGATLRLRGMPGMGTTVSCILPFSAHT